LIKKGVSIPNISKFLNVGRSTIYYHYKKIKGRKYPLVNLSNNDKVKGEFLGVFSGDGNFFFDKNGHHYRICISLHAIDDKDYGFYLKEVIKKNFNKKVRVYFTKDNALRLVFYSKKIYQLIDEYLNIKGYKTLNISLKKSIFSLSDDFLTYFVRGVIDTDGHVNKHSQIILGLISKRLILQISNILKLYNVNYSGLKPVSVTKVIMTRS